MGKAWSKNQAIDPKYLKPTFALYKECAWDQKLLKKMILERKLAPFFPGSETEGPDLEECFICMLNYPGGLNRSRCCKKPICTECYLQVKKPDPRVPVSCPFCMTPKYSAAYAGPKTQEEREIDRAEEQKVLELQIQMRQEEIRQDEERKKARTMSLPAIRPNATSTSPPAATTGPMPAPPAAAAEKKKTKRHRTASRTIGQTTPASRVVSAQFAHSAPARPRPKDSPKSPEEWEALRREYGMEIEQLQIMEAIRLSLLETNPKGAEEGSGSDDASPEAASPVSPSTEAVPKVRGRESLSPQRGRRLDIEEDFLHETSLTPTTRRARKLASPTHGSSVSPPASPHATSRSPLPFPVDSFSDPDAAGSNDGLVSPRSAARRSSPLCPDDDARRSATASPAAPRAAGEMEVSTDSGDEGMALRGPRYRRQRPARSPRTARAAAPAPVTDASDDEERELALALALSMGDVLDSDALARGPEPAAAERVSELVVAVASEPLPADVSGVDAVVSRTEGIQDVRSPRRESPPLPAVVVESVTGVSRDAPVEPASEPVVPAPDARKKVPEDVAGDEGEDLLAPRRVRRVSGVADVVDDGGVAAAPTDKVVPPLDAPSVSMEERVVSEGTPTPAAEDSARVDSEEPRVVVESAPAEARSLPATESLPEVLPTQGQPAVTATSAIAHDTMFADATSLEQDMPAEPTSHTVHVSNDAPLLFGDLSHGPSDPALAISESSVLSFSVSMVPPFVPDALPDVLDRSAMSEHFNSG